MPASSICISAPELPAGGVPAGSLAAAGGIHAGEGEKVDHPELAGDGTASRRESGPPARLPQERAAIELQQPDDDLADDAAADWAQAPATLHDLGLLEDVVPEWRRRFEAQPVAAQLA